jgi:hypothetical protein
LAGTVVVVVVVDVVVVVAGGRVVVVVVAGAVVEVVDPAPRIAGAADAHLVGAPIRATAAEAAHTTAAARRRERGMNIGSFRFRRQEHEACSESALRAGDKRVARRHPSAVGT